jgi:hypothetical protein
MRSRSRFFHLGNPVNPAASVLEIAKALKEIDADYTRHPLATREIARQFFDAEILSRVGWASRPPVIASRDHELGKIDSLAPARSPFGLGPCRSAPAGSIV